MPGIADVDQAGSDRLGERTVGIAGEGQLLGRDESGRATARSPAIAPAPPASTRRGPQPAMRSAYRTATTRRTRPYHHRSAAPQPSDWHGDSAVPRRAGRTGGRSSSVAHKAPYASCRPQGGASGLQVPSASTIRSNGGLTVTILEQQRGPLIRYPAGDRPARVDHDARRSHGREQHIEQCRAVDAEAADAAAERPIGDVEYRSSVRHAEQPIDARRSRTKLRIEAKFAQHRQAGRLDHQPGTKRPGLGKAFEQFDRMTGTMKQQCRRKPGGSAPRDRDAERRDRSYSTVTDLARLRG